MNLDDKIGQMMVFGWMGDTPDELLTLSDRPRRMIRDLRCGNIIFMTRNTKRPAQVSRLCEDLQAFAAGEGLPPLLIAIDQEGGPRTRLIPPEFRASRDAWAVGETGRVSEARREASEIGRELRAMGINWNLAPVLDVNNNPANPIIGRRSFGANAELVAQMATEAVAGYQCDAGIMACGKHFPGHGDTEVDSHKALPTIPHGLDRLRSLELAPFAAAVHAGIAAIMTAHILFPAVDAQLPATLSRSILGGILRQELGFSGVVVTDCLEMNGISARWSMHEAAVLAVEAGADMLLCCHTPDRQEQVRAGLVGAVRCGRISERRIDESMARIASAKAAWALPADLPESAV